MLKHLNRCRLLKGYNMKHKTYFSYLMLILFFFAFNFLSNTVSDAKIIGPCVNCHTMHNSQNGTAMIAYLAPGETDTNPKELLLRGTCLGCHGRNTANNIDPVTGAPQVLHTGATDLAGGNFGYITGAKSRITATQNSAGHNVIDLGNSFNETTLAVPPGHHGANLTNTNFTCAGNHGCHGIRDMNASSGLRALKGAHHQNVDGKCETDISQIYGSYRFLWYVKGFENVGTYKWENKDSNNHNEYFGAITPMSFVCTDCHHGSSGPGVNLIWSSKNTISGFCATCHENFHVLSAGAPLGWGIGGGTSPFIRHPTDIVLKGSGEYASYTTYSVEAPVARTAVPSSASNTVTPGTDVVMCLSCHSAHATPYADMLRWDYTTMVAGGGGSGGCFTCHTQKK